MENYPNLKKKKREKNKNKPLNIPILQSYKITIYHAICIKPDFSYSCFIKKQLHYI